MKSEQAGWDRIVRIVLGAAMLYLGWAGRRSGGWGSFFKAVGSCLVTAWSASARSTPPVSHVQGSLKASQRRETRAVAPSTLE
jgi:hypothetical protein